MWYFPFPYFAYVLSYKKKTRSKLSWRCFSCERLSLLTKTNENNTTHIELKSRSHYKIKVKKTRFIFIYLWHLTDSNAAMWFQSATHFFISFFKDLTLCLLCYSFENKVKKSKMFCFCKRLWPCVIPPLNPAGLHTARARWCCLTQVCAEPGWFYWWLWDEWIHQRSDLDEDSTTKQTNL